MQNITIDNYNDTLIDLEYELFEYEVEIEGKREKIYSQKSEEFHFSIPKNVRKIKSKIVRINSFGKYKGDSIATFECGYETHVTNLDGVDFKPQQMGEKEQLLWNIKHGGGLFFMDMYQKVVEKEKEGL